MTINMSNQQINDGEFIIKHLTIMKDSNVFCSFKFQNSLITQEERKIIKNFNYANYAELGSTLQRNVNLNFNNNSTINFQEKIQNEKNEKNNSIIYNNEINPNYPNPNSSNNNDNVFNKNNSFTPNFLSNNIKHGNTGITGITGNTGNTNANSTNNVNNVFPYHMQQSIKENNTTNNNVNLNQYITGNNFINNNGNGVNQGFYFFKLLIKNLKIIILKKQDILLFGFFGTGTNTCFIKGYLLHIYTVFMNYSGDIFDIAKNKFKDGIFFTGFKQNLYFREYSNSCSPVRDKRDFSSNANHFIINNNANLNNPQKPASGKNQNNNVANNYYASNSNNPATAGASNVNVGNNNDTENNNNPSGGTHSNSGNNNLIEISNFIQMMNKKFFEVKL